MSKRNRREGIGRRQLVWLLVSAVAVVALLVYLMPRSTTVQYDYALGRPWYDSPIMARETFPLLKSDSLWQAELAEARKAYQPIYEIDTEIDDTLFIMAPDELDALRKAGTQAITASVGNVGRTVYVYELLTPKTAYQLTRQEHSVNLALDAERSANEMKRIERSISKYRGEIQAGQEIVRRGQIVDDETYRALRSMEAFYRTANKGTSRQMLSQVAGHALYVGLVVAALLVFLFQFRSSYLQTWRTMAYIAFMVVAFPFFACMLQRVFDEPYVALAVPYCILPIFTRVFLDSRTAFLTHSAMVLICAAIVSYPYEFIVTELLAGMAAVYTMRQLQQRSELMTSALTVMVVSLVTYATFDLTGLALFTDEGINYVPYVMLIVSALLLLVSYLLLIPFEKTFRFTSSVTLVELSNTNTPLLRRLAEEAPGTFQHSMQVANLASEVALRFGADSLMGRTAALYHYIGKLRHPGYYTENQAGLNPHDRLTPEKSASVIIEHVDEGLRLAAQHNLPRIVRDFIASHHGAGQAKYFLMKAQRERSGIPVDSAPFTYPGPDPQTAEQAILMMADAVEAASRSLKDYDEQSIGTLVERIVDGQQSEGRFRMAPISFRDLSVAKQTLTAKLLTIYHTRIAYPDAKA